MAEVDIHLYQLKPPRKGALLRVRGESGAIGFADCHPWPELGDLPIEGQLDLLKHGQKTELTRRSLFFAEMDGRARATGKDLWEGLTVPPSHRLVSDWTELTETHLADWATEGFVTLKVKIGTRLEEETKTLLSLRPFFRRYGIKLRLDFNHSQSPASIENFLKQVEPLIPQIDFLEDPMPYMPETWRAVQERWKIRLAVDRITPALESALVPGTFSVRVVKPAIQDPDRILLDAEKFGASVVMTTYLDHPFGQLCAAWCAAYFAVQKGVEFEACGLLSNSAPSSDPFATAIRHRRSVLVPPVGTGFGMNSQLEKVKWTPL